MRRFDERSAPRLDEVPISIKVRVTLGCFHRQHSLRGYELIDQHLRKSPSDAEIAFEEHESGPEVLVYLAVATAGISLVKSVVDLITTIIKARSEGVKKGDGPSAPIELIVRRLDYRERFREEVVLRVGHQDPVDPKDVECQLREALRRLVKNQGDG